MTSPLTNWAGNVRYGATRVHRPVTVAELRGMVAGARRVRALGTGHSFSAVADTTDELVSTAGLPTVMEIDRARRVVAVSAGTRYGELATYLHAAGYALPNLASLPHISVAGACATGTHGSGERNGTLSTAVSALELVTADGSLVTVARGDPDFAGTVVALGALGVVTLVTLDLVPTFEVSQYVYRDLPWERLPAHLDEVMGAGYSVSLFTDWTGPAVRQVWLKLRADQPSPPRRWLGATAVDAPCHPVPGMPAANCTEQLGVPGPWHERLPHFRLGFTPSSGDELQSEFFVPRSGAVDALAAVRALGDRIAPVLWISEVRTVAADDLWLSPCHERDSLAIHFTWLGDVAAVTPVLAAVEAALRPFAARPHWAKLFGATPTGYRRLPDFVRLVGEYDPTGTFRNAFTDRLLS